MIFLRLMPQLETSFFLCLLLLITFYTVCEGKAVLWATAERKSRAWWHQVHEERLHALQTSAWGVCTIDYRLDDEKKNSGVGATSWYHCVAEDSRIPKMPVINPLQALVHP
jgi:hypothetical protein